MSTVKLNKVKKAFEKTTKEQMSLSLLVDVFQSFNEDDKDKKQGLFKKALKISDKEHFVDDLFLHYCNVKKSLKQEVINQFVLIDNYLLVIDRKEIFSIYKEKISNKLLDELYDLVLKEEWSKVNNFYKILGIDRLLNITNYTIIDNINTLLNFNSAEYKLVLESASENKIEYKAFVRSSNKAMLISLSDELIDNVSEGILEETSNNE